MKSRYLSLNALIPWRQVQRPIAWPKRFGRTAPIEVEIGFGNGEYLVRHALNHPQRDFIGIELEWASIQRCLRKIAQAGLTNVRLMQIHAQTAFDRLFCPGMIDRVYALFPCPWPKQRHIKHRLFSHAFLNLVNSRLAWQGELQIVTDDDAYGRWVEEQSCKTGFACERHAVAATFSTKYERKWQAKGQLFFYELSLVKQRSTSIPLREDKEVQVHRVQAFDPEQFHPLDQQGEITIRFKDLIYDPQQMRAMQWVYIYEDNLGQDVWIDIVQSGDGWLIRPARGCSFIPTEGLQQALDLIYRIIASQTQQHPA